MVLFATVQKYTLTNHMKQIAHSLWTIKTHEK